MLHRSGEHELTFIGTRGGGGFEKRLVDDFGLPFHAYGEVYAGPIVGVNPLRAASSLGKMGLGVMQALRLLNNYRPQAILLTGGWANVPLALAARLRGIPMLIFLPDIEPGSTIKLLSRFVRKVAVTTPASEPHFKPGQMVVTGYPLRQAFNAVSRDQAIDHFGLDPGRKTLLVTGGSRGARNINLAIEQILPSLLANGVQVLHLTGTLDYDRSQQATAELPGRAHYHALAYTEDMALAYAAADLVVARAGASVLGELPHFGLPGILIPYPYAWRYQRVNADYLSERGAALRLVDDDTLAERLLPAIRSVLYDEERLTSMRAAAQSLAQPDAAGRIATLLCALAEES